MIFLRTSQRMVEFAQAQSVLRAFNGSGGATRLLDQAIDQQRQSGQRLIYRSSLSAVLNAWAVQGIFSALLVAVALWCDALDAHEAIAACVALVLVCRYIEPLLEVASYGEILRSANAQLDAVHSILAEPPLPVAAQPKIPTDSSVELRNVSFRYAPDEPQVLRGVSLRIAPGSMTALIGASGSGKTTLVRLLARFFDASQGQVLIGGVDVREMSETALAAQISQIFQDTYLFQGSIADNIRLGKPGASLAEIAAVAEQAGVAEIIARLPLGLHTPVGEGGARLSGGERQRIAIARALLKDAPILLVDDAIIAVEMMAIKMEQGYDRLKAASFAWTSTAFPMLTGTLITAAGFLPIAMAQSSTGEYTRSIFQVVTIALLASWIAAVVFVPYLGALLLPDLAKIHAAKHGSGAGAPDPYATPFYQRVRRLVEWCVTRRKTVIALTVLLFLGSVVLFKFVPQQFFPASSRLELMVDLKLAEGASLSNTTDQVKQLEALLKDHPGIANYVAYAGTGSPRYYLPLDQQLPAASFAQFVVLAKTIEDREELRTWLIDTLNEQFPTVRSRVTRLENGPPVGYPVQFRVTGEHIEEVRALARKVAAKVRDNPHVVNVHLDWEEPSKVVYLNIDQDRARALGVSTANLSRFLQSTLLGSTVSQYREDNELIEILLRGTPQERTELALLPSLAVPTDNGQSVALSQVATLEYGFEEGIIWHRNRLPNVTVRADIYGKEQPATLVQQILPTLEGVRAELPDGYLLDVGGTVEDSTRGQDSVKAGVPLFIVVVLTLLMVQLRSFSRMVMVFLTAPLGLIGVTLFLLLFGKPFGFVAMLGTIALSGMIMRNSVILVDQIEQDKAAGLDPWRAIIEATVRRFRPIVLTALAAVLAMIPLSRSVFFGPMAVAIMGGLIVATALTLLFLPALYAAWFKVKKPAEA